MFDKYDLDNFKKISVPNSINGRLDKVLATLIPDYSRERIKRWIRTKYVLVNGLVAKISQNVKFGDIIHVCEQPTEESLSFIPENVEFSVIGESKDWLIINKPFGLVTHPGSGNWSSTLLNGLLYRYPELLCVPRAGIVHRLDKNTSGVMIVARNIKSQIFLVKQLQLRNINREYLAITHGHLSNEGMIDRPIGRDVKNPIKMSVNNSISPKKSITHYYPISFGIAGCGSRVSQVKCRLETGRTHQIRVHLSSIGYPIVGDTIYNGKNISSSKRHFLHSELLSFISNDGNRYEFYCPIPDDMKSFIDSINWQS